MRTRFVIGILGAVLVRSTASGISRQPDDRGLQISKVCPQDTDPDISIPCILDFQHLVYLDRRAVPNGKLLVFLPGSHGRPDGTTRILDLAARHGYHAIGLMWPTYFGALHCKTDDGCYTDFHEDLFHGTCFQEGTCDGREIFQNLHNTVENLVTRLIVYENQVDRDGAWGQFLVRRNDGSAAPRYSQIVFAGLSLGSGQAAYIGTQVRVDRVVQFSGTEDSLPAISSEPADHAPLTMQDEWIPVSWLSAAKATPVDWYYGFSHERDPFHLRTIADWGVLGMGQFGDPVDVDSAPRDYNGSHQLITAYPVDPIEKAHVSTVGDRYTPYVNGQPVFEPVWEYMLGIDR